MRYVSSKVKLSCFYAAFNVTWILLMLRRIFWILEHSLIVKINASEKLQLG